MKPVFFPLFVLEFKNNAYICSDMIPLNYIFTPLIAAGIGYVTNDIAIRMLFRPHKAKHIFGRRVWFTPGVIPKEKGRIAASIGEAISANLMNHDVMKETLLSDEMLQKVGIAFDELVEISKGTPLKLHYSHAIFVGRSSMKDKEELLRMMEQLRTQGVDVMFDIYNECLGVSVITVILPGWYQGMSQAERKKPLNRLKLAALVKASSLLLGFGFKDILVAYIGPGYERYEGKTVHQIAREEGLSDLKAYLKLCELSNFKGRVNMGPYSTPEIISEFEHNPHCLYMTDAWVEEHGVQNPAIYDCYPKFLRDALRGTGDSLPNTLRRMTGAIADRFQIRERGYLRPGFYADLTVFDEEALGNGVPDREQPFGIEKVFVNGKLVLDDGALDEAALKTAGRTIRIS